MSTYTDLHNQVKENIAVDYHNRITPQRVRLFNEENEYWGTFKGHVTAEDIQIKGGSISAATLFDTKLCGNIDIPGIGVLSTYTDKIKQISATADAAAAGLVDESRARILADNELVKRIDAISLSGISADLDRELGIVSTELSTKFDAKLSLVSAAISTVFDEKLDNANKHADKLCADLCAEISSTNIALATEVSARTADDSYLSSKIDELRGDLEAEANGRLETDQILSNQIIDLEETEAEHYAELTADIADHKAENEQRFDEADAKMLSTVAHDKHYEIYGEAEGLFNSYPYKLKDYAMNVVHTAINTAVIVDAKNGNAIVGSVTESAAKTEIKFYDLENDPELRKMVHPKSSYTFEATGPQYVIDGGYRISYDKATKRIVVSPTATAKYYKLTYDGQEIGVIESPEIAPDRSLISGSMTVNTSGPLSVFNGFIREPFSRDNPEMVVGAERIEFIGPNYTTFNFRKYVSDIWYCPISAYNKSVGKYQEVARILSGNIKREADRITEIEVSCQNESVRLLESTGFAGTFGDGLRLSCNVIDNEEGIFALDHISAFYKYKLFEESDKTMSGPVLGYAIPGKENTTLSSKNFSTLSVILTIPDYETASGKYKLEKVTGVAYDIWRGTTEFDGGYITVEYNTQTVKFYGTKYGIKFKGNYAAKVNDPNPEIYEDATTVRNLWTSEQVYWNREENYKKIISDAGHYTVNAVGPYDPSKEALELTITSKGANVLKLQVPDKPFADVSRELMMVLNVRSEEPIISVDLLSSNGAQVDFYNNKTRSFILSSGVWSTFALNEVRHNKFLLRDVNETDQVKDFKVLSAKVDAEIQRSIEADIEHDAQLRTISIDLLQHVEDAEDTFVGISAAVESNFIHLSGDTGIGDLVLDGGISAASGNFDALEAGSVKASTLSVSFANIVDGLGAGSLSVLGELVEPCLLSVCNRINEIITYAELSALDKVSVDAELIDNIVARTRSICTLAGIGVLPSDPTLGQVVDKLNESLKHFTFKGTGLSLESRLQVLKLAVDNAVSMIHVQHAEIEALSADLTAYVATENAISARLSSVDPFNSETFVKQHLTTGKDLTVDNLVMTDEVSPDGHTYNKYRLTVASGTLVLKKI